jgi:predicted flap endonuclease-1-like 5' DNA nuclease
MKLADIEGIGPAQVAKLAAAGIRTPNDLLMHASTPGRRKSLAASTGISQDLILRWVNMADLFRIKGIGLVYVDLLDEVGVDTSRKLSKRKPKQLMAQMQKANSEKKLARKLPSLKQIQKAIAIAMEIQHSSSHILAGNGTTDAPPPKKRTRKHGPRVEY